MKKILPKEYPITCTMSTDSHLFSILQTFENGIDWLMSHFILWCGTNNLSGALFEYIYILPYRAFYYNWRECELLDFDTFDESQIHTNDDFIGYVKQRIDDGWYCHMHFDQYHIGKTKKSHYLHHSLVYGYDDDKRIFYLADHFDKGRYQELTCGYDELECAFKDVFTYKLAEFENGHTAYLLKIKEDAVVSKKYTLSGYYLNEIQTAIDAMLSSDVTGYLSNAGHHKSDPRFDHVYGLALYDCYIKYISDLIDKKTEHIDYRLITNIRDHMNLMILRIEYYANKDLTADPKTVAEILSHYKKIHMTAKIILSLYMKYSMDKEDTSLEKITEYLKSIKHDEA